MNARLVEPHDCAFAGVVGGLLGSRVGKITVPFALAGTIESPKVTPGKGIPAIGAGSSTAGSKPTIPAITPENAVDTLKGFFNKKK